MDTKKGNQKHLTYMDRAFIEQSLETDMSFRQIAEELGKDPSTISKEIRKHRIISGGKSGRGFTDCRLAPMCQKQHICLKSGCQYYCATCSRYRCDKRCGDYIPTACDKLRKPPYVCNGCERRQYCRLGKYYYRAKFADDSYIAVLRESRKGIDMTPEDFDHLDKLVSPLIKKGQSVSHIFTKHEEEIPCSKRTLYNYLGDGMLTAKSIDLPRKMRYKPKRKNAEITRSVPNDRLRRTYMDFQKYLKENPDVSVVEMDTVHGKMGGKVMLTMLFRNSSLMLAFLMNGATRENVLEVFERLETALGTEMFQKTFPVILTDNGAEFRSPEFMECTRWGEVRTKIYFCDPNASWQKGQLERNHEFIRYVIPKGRSFDHLSQTDVTLMINHINSLARDSLGGMTPYEASIFTLDPKVHRKLRLKPVPRDDVMLRPGLFKLTDS